MEGLRLVLLLTAITWATSGARGATPPTTLPDGQPKSGRNKLSGEPAASANTAVSAPLPPLQNHLNSICEQKLEERCKTEKDEMCNTSPVARKGVGTLPEQADLAWRCYGNLSFEEGKREVQCVDSCGVTFKCLGSVPAKSLHMTVPDLETAINDNLEKFCSPYQKVLNEHCNNLKDGWVARKGVLTAKEEKQKWRCYDVAVLEYERSSQCLDNCGTVSACRGSRSHEDASSLKEGSDFATIDEADEQLSAVERPCTEDQVCMPTLQNPPKCVLPHEVEAAREEAAAAEEQYAAATAEEQEQEQDGEGGAAEDAEVFEWGAVGKQSQDGNDTGGMSPPQDLRLGSPLVHPVEETVTRADRSSPRTLSALLSSYCLKEFDHLCVHERLDDFCVDDTDTVVARKDLGRPNGAESLAWRCVEKRKLDATRSSVCVDACGQPYVCPGGVDPENTVHAVWPQLEIAVREKATEQCAKFSGGLPPDTSTG